MKKLVVLTGAGISAESGIETFRDAGGLWEGHDVMSVASPLGWRENRDLVLDFYNQRRQQLLTVKPNSAHESLAILEAQYDVTIITQNIDNLHERGGSTHVLHLHGELMKARSTLHEHLLYHWPKDILPGDTCEKGSQLRPHVVWFGEEVPMMVEAIPHVSSAEILLIIGTSMVVYPAAGLVEFARPDCEIYYIDPNPYVGAHLSSRLHIQVIPEKAGNAIPVLVKKLLTE